MNVLNVTELYNLKLLTLSYMNFTSLKKDSEQNGRLKPYGITVSLNVNVHISVEKQIGK